MEVFLARQPIYNVLNQVYGYEILYRDGYMNNFPDIDGNEATSSVLTRCFVDFGINEITNNKKAFVNFTTEFLKKDIATMFPREFLVVELLEDVIIDDEIVSYCNKLKTMGYTIAIDDFVYQEGYDKIFDIVDIIKVDFRQSSKEERKNIIEKYKRKNIEFLAEKVETYKEYNEAINLGYKYFQGYYFSKPEITSKKKITPFRGSYAKLIELINSDEPEFDGIANIIENDISFSYEILRLVNSAYFERKNKITSIRYALVTLGSDELKKWIYLAIMREFKSQDSEEILIQSMIRGKFMENIALRINEKQKRLEMMTIGMFSMIDILTNKSIDEITNEINFSDNIKLILQGKLKEGIVAEAFELVLNYENGEWNNVEKLIDKVKISISDLNDAYLEALKWIKKVNI